MNLQTLFQNFNPSKFLVHTCMMIFTILFSLRLDNYIEWSYWSIFTPIWIWKSMVIAGATVGSFVWWRHPHSRLEVCDKLESKRHIWILVFIPLIFISIVSIAVCIWAVKHDRTFELELFCAVNVLQFIFLALKLDGLITWSWEVVFVPFWALLCLSLIAVLYTIIIAAALLRAPQVNARVRANSVNSALAYTFLVVPMIVFQVLLSKKLDGDISLNYTTVAAPLLLSHVTLIFMSFGAKGGNKWWFGIRKEFCHFLLGLCPLLQEYGNISYQPRSDNDQPTSEPIINDKHEKHIKKIDLMKPVVPIISIDLPD